MKPPTTVIYKGQLYPAVNILIGMHKSSIIMIIDCDVVDGVPTAHLDCSAIISKTLDIDAFVDSLILEAKAIYLNWVTIYYKDICHDIH